MPLLFVVYVVAKPFSAYPTRGLGTLEFHAIQCLSDPTHNTRRIYCHPFVFDGDGAMKPLVIKRSVMIDGRKTSISLEDPGNRPGPAIRQRQSVISYSDICSSVL
jgi:hypothetical protein